MTSRYFEGNAYLVGKVVPLLLVGDKRFYAVIKSKGKVSEETGSTKWLNA